ncbi:MAG: phosphopentomutase [Clostridiales bacterium]|nr:phosphopentomutase [Clostridiales bacterium]
MKVKRAFIIVLDSYGIGHAPDAADFGDEGSNTLGTITRSSRYHTPNMCRMGLFNIDGVDCGPKEPSPIAAYGRLEESSRGKDTTIGHWEIAGIISRKPLPVYPSGFPKEVLDEFSRRTGRGVLCNLPYSGTDVIRDYGDEHVKTGKLIVYTSADSVFQIAAHEEVVPLEELYQDCRIAREILTGDHSAGRVIARPFVGADGQYTRTPHRHDFSLLPPSTTMMDVLTANGLASKGVGKIYDIFAGKSIQTTVSIENNVDGMNKTLAIQQEDFQGLCFVNLVDFDMLYGHRNDIDGYANAATVFDRQLEEFMGKMREDDVLFITADHGCDPGYPGTDHSRECVPMLLYGNPVKQGVNLGTRKTYADIAATVLDIFGLSGDIAGTSFWDLVKKD